MASQKIDPLSVITQHTPTPETPKSASSWFKTERMELDFGDYVGRPSENVTAHKDALTALLADGWYVTEVSNGGSDGEWKRVSNQRKSGIASSTENRNSIRTGLEQSQSQVQEQSQSQAQEQAQSQSQEQSQSQVQEQSQSQVQEQSQSQAQEQSQSQVQEQSQSQSQEQAQGQAQEQSASFANSDAFGYSSSTNNYNTFTNGTKDSGATSGGGTSTGSTDSNSNNSSQEQTQVHSQETSNSNSNETSNSNTNENTNRNSNENSNSNSNETSNSNSNETSNSNSNETSNSNSNESTNRNSNETSNSNSNENSTETSTGSQTDTETVSADETDPYWCAWQKIRLERRRMQAELVLQSMVDTFVANFNEGRQINVDRYEELVALYALMVSQTQDDAANIDLDSIDFEPLFDEVKDAITNRLNQYQSVADQIPSDWLESRKADINLKFNNLVAEARAKMISDGTYNGTVWPSVLAGIEHQRSHALDALKDESVTLKLSAYGDIAKTTAALYGQMIDAQVRVFEALKSKKTTPITLRNEVLKWMYDFMERRTDDHVKIEELASLVQQMGYDGGIVAPQSVSS